LIIVNAKVESVEGQEITVIIESVRKLTEAISLEARNVSIELPTKNLDEKYIDDLFTILSRSRGNCEVYLHFNLENQMGIKIMSQPIRIQGSELLEQELLQKGCRVNWIL
jgi:DUF4097 and DUF4098 domain-containing protein YvlB